jgi:hypothetical protein
LAKSADFRLAIRDRYADRLRGTRSRTWWRRLHPVLEKLGFFLTKIIFTPMALVAAMKYACLNNLNGGFL